MPEFIAHEPYVPGRPALEAARDFCGIMRRRRSVRMFSDRPVPLEVIEAVIESATTAPSGANKQPWRFVCVQDADTKHRIRLAAEREERELYEKRANAEWLADLAPLGTDANKEFLDIAPWLIVVFKLMRADGGGQHYYPTESVGLASGMLLAAAQHAGLATLTHTPSPMGFLREVLGRPEHERPFLLIPIGYPAESCEVPAVASLRKPLDEVMIVV